MSSHIKQLPNDEAFWIGLVENNVRLRWERTLVPFSNLSAEVAKALANRLEVKLEIEKDGYVFIQVHIL